MNKTLKVGDLFRLYNEYFEPFEVCIFKSPEEAKKWCVDASYASWPSNQKVMAFDEKIGIILEKKKKICIPLVAHREIFVQKVLYGNAIGYILTNDMEKIDGK